MMRMLSILVAVWACLRVTGLAAGEETAEEMGETAPDVAKEPAPKKAKPAKPPLEIPAEIPRRISNVWLKALWPVHPRTRGRTLKRSTIGSALISNIAMDRSETHAKR